MLEDGLPVKTILQQLGKHGQGLSKQNISNWRSGGFQDYLAEQRLIEQSQSRHELALRLAKESYGVAAFQTAHQVSASIICAALADFGPQTIRTACQANPLNLIRLLNSLARLTDGGLKCERHQKENQPKPVHRKGGLPTELRKQIEKELRLM